MPSGAALYSGEHPGCHFAQLTVEPSSLALPRSWSVAKALMTLCLMNLPPPSVAQYRDSWYRASGFQQGHYHPARPCRVINCGAFAEEIPLSLSLPDCITLSLER